MYAHMSKDQGIKTTGRKYSARSLGHNTANTGHVLKKSVVSEIMHLSTMNSLVNYCYYNSFVKVYLMVY